MKTKLFSLLFAIVASIGTVLAWDYEHVQIGDLYFNLDATNQTAEVTNQNSSSPYWSTQITTADIRSSVTYNGVTYSVTSIGDNSFYNCDGLTLVVIPNSVKCIGDCAFYNCSDLTSVNMSYEITSFGAYAFYGCSSLTSIEIPNIVTSIGEKTFYGCSSLTSIEIPNSITSIGKYAFSNCTGLTAVTIPNSVTSIGEKTFEGCIGLTSITCEATYPPSLESGVFNNVNKSIPLYIPEGSAAAYQAANQWSDFVDIQAITIYEHVQIDEFYYNLDATSQRAEVTYQYQWPSSNYMGLTAISIPSSVTYNDVNYSVTSIGYAAFYDCFYLTNIVIPNSVTIIENSAFESCYGLTNIKLPSGLTSIGSSAFANCGNISSIYNNSTIPQTIDENVFYNVDVSACVLHVPNEAIDAYKDTEVWSEFIYTDAIFGGTFGAEGDNLTWQLNIRTGNLVIEGTGAMSSPIPWSKYKKHVITVSLPTGLTRIGNNAFQGCSNLSSIDIPSNVKSIGNMAFAQCSSITSVTIPNSVDSLGSAVFYECGNLNSVVFPSSILKAGYGLFNGCKKLMTPIFNSHIFAYMPESYIGEYSIPNGIETVAGQAFIYCKNLTSVIMPNSVTYIGPQTFYECSNLQNVSLGEGLITIDFGAFDMCPFENIILPNSLINLDGNDQGLGGPFSSCRNLTAIIVPNNTTHIGALSFSHCTSLESVIIGENVEWIGRQAFVECRSLKSVIIPNKVNEIRWGVFEDCSSLRSVTIGRNVSTIEWNAFKGCNNLDTIYNLASIPQTVDNTVFNGVNKSTCILLVPAARIAAYQAAEQWSEFTNIQAIPGTSVAITANEDPEHAGTYYSTFYYSSGHYELPAAGVEAFVATVSGSDMNLTRIAGGAGVIPQGTAVILKSTMASYNLTLRDDTPVFEGTNVLQGVDEATTTPANCYVLSAVDGVVGFYQYTGEQVGAHKAYLVYNGAGAPRRMRFVFDEENAATSIDVVEQPCMDVQKFIENGQLVIEANGVRYNAQGQKVK